MNPTEANVKHASCTQDLETVTRLQFSGRKSKHLGIIPKLTNLVELDLSNNELTSLEGLGYLTCLQKLNVSNNQLCNLKGLEKLKALRVLECDGNAIASFDKDVAPFLRGLNKLSTVRFRSSSRTNKNNTDEGNPMCNTDTYLRDVFNALPGVRVCDGEMITLRNVCSLPGPEELAVPSGVDLHLLPTTEPWMESFGLGSPFSINLKERFECETDFRKALEDAHELADVVE